MKGRTFRIRQQRRKQNHQQKTFKGKPSSSADWLSLQKWCKAQGMPKSMLTLAYFSQTFRGMMATRHIKAGDPLIKVPERLLITASKVKRSILLRDPQLRSSIQTLTEHQLLVYWVYIQNSAHSWTEWAWYVKTLPKSFDSVPLYVLSGEMPSENILLASDFEKWLFDHLPHSVQLKVIEQQRRLYGDWKCTSSLQGSIVLPTDWRRYVWAWLIVNTRCIHLGRQYAPQQCVKCITQRSDSYLLWPICDCDSIALAPVLDLLNHSCHASVLTYFDTASRQFVIKTLLPYSKGQEAFISYGPHENGFMLAEYGFVIANNPYSVLTLDNKVEEWVSSAKNSLSKPRRSLLDAKNLDRLVEVLQSNGMWGDFTLRESEEELPYRLQAAMLLLLLTTVLRVSFKEALSKWNHWRHCGGYMCKELDTAMKHWIQQTCADISNTSCSISQNICEMSAKLIPPQKEQRGFLVHCLGILWNDIYSIASKFKEQ
ncbi:hypothetical protein BX667DRAFT_471796 [Coemansia mojavensis]|nr:hypothetical protein BX667DRAFT_471796 [Coemansia mojavensis]